LSSTRFEGDRGSTVIKVLC